MSGDLYLFGYGSVLFEPERPDALLDMQPATWPGVQRAFNKTSTRRGCALAACSAPTVPDFVADGQRLSLVLGTEPGEGIEGFVLRYPASVSEDVMERMNLREGFDPQRERAANGYLPTTAHVRLASGQVLPATAWRSNPSCRAYVGVLPVSRVAAILRAATPDLPGPRAQGAAYLEGVRGALASAGLRDAALDHLSLALKALG